MDEQNKSFHSPNYLTDDHDPSLVEKCCHQQVSWRAGMLHWYHLLKQDHYREDPRVTSNVLSPVTIKCLMHEPCKGEILVGFVDKILKCRVSLSRDHMIACFFRRRRWGDCNSFLLPRLILNILLWFGCWLGLLWLNFWLHTGLSKPFIILELHYECSHFLWVAITLACRDRYIERKREIYRRWREFLH